MTIEPDNKDWTWVLDRPCPECGFDTQSFPREQIGTMLRENAAEWRRMLATASAPARRPKPAKWSLLEYACHVRDVFRLYDERLRLMLDEDGPSFANWDQDKTAIEERYAEQDPTTVSADIKAAVVPLADRFDGVHDEQWSRTGYRSDGATFTVETFGRYLMHDPAHHLWDVR